MHLQHDSIFYQSFLKRITAGVAILTFATTQVELPHAWAQTPGVESAGAFKELSGHLDALKIPANIGKLEEVYQGTGSRLVVLIQDAHGIPEAQRNIRNLIDFFQHTYGIQMLTLEGAASRLNPQVFRSFPDKESLKQTFKEYLERGELTGTAMAAIFNEIQGTYEGVEDWALYEEGYGYFLESLRKQDELVEKLETLDADLLKRQERTYSSDLMKVDRSVRDFRSNLAGIVDLLRTLAVYQKPEKGSELDLLYEESLRDTDSQIPAEVEAKRLGEQVKDYLASKPSPSAGDREMLSLFNEKFQAFKVSELSAQEFMLFLKDTAASANLKLQFSKSMSQLMKRQKKMRDIEGTRFFESLEAYAAGVKRGLMKSAEEQLLETEEQEIGLLRSLARLEVSRKQWNQFMTLASGKNILLNGHPELREDMNAPVAFYVNAEKRDAAFVRNLQRIKAPGDAMIFVAGGFHTEGLIRRLKEEGASYALIMPEIGNLPDEVLYRDHIRGLVSWRDYFRVEQGKVDVYKAFVRATRDRLLNKAADQGAMLKEWRDEIIRDLADQNQLADTGRHVRYLDEKMSETQPDGNQLMEKVERFIEGLKELQIRNQINEQSILQLLRPATIADLTSAALAEANPLGSTRRFAMSERGLVPVDISVPQEPVFTADSVSPELSRFPSSVRPELRAQVSESLKALTDALAMPVNVETDNIPQAQERVRKAWADFEAAFAAGERVEDVTLMDLLNAYRASPFLGSSASKFLKNFLFAQRDTTGLGNLFSAWIQNNLAGAAPVEGETRAIHGQGTLQTVFRGSPQIGKLLTDASQAKTLFESLSVVRLVTDYDKYVLGSRNTKNDFTIQLGPRLFVRSDTDSFRRHIFYETDGAGQITGSVEIKMPGQNLDKRQIDEEDYLVSEQLAGLPALAPYLQRALGVLEYPAGNYQLYGDQVAFDQEHLQHQTFRVVVSEYEASTHSGRARAEQYLGKFPSPFFTKYKVANPGEEPNEERPISRDQAVKIAGQIADIMGTLFANGWTGGADLQHLQNFEINRRGYEFSVRLPNDFGAFIRAPEGPDDGAALNMNVSANKIEKLLIKVLPGVGDEIRQIFKDRVWAVIQARQEMRVENLETFDVRMRELNEQTEGINRVLLYFAADEQAVTLDVKDPLRALRNPQEWLRAQMPANRDLDALMPFTLELKQHDRVVENGTEALLNVVVLDFSRSELRPGASRVAPASKSGARAQEFAQQPLLFRISAWMPLGKAVRALLQGLSNFSRSQTAAGAAGFSLAAVTLVGGLWIASMLGGLGILAIAAGTYGAVLFALNSIPFIAGQTRDKVVSRPSARAGEFKAEDFQYSAKDFPQGLGSEEYRRVISRINSAIKITSERMNIPQSFRDAGIPDGSQVKAYVFKTSDEQVRVKLVASVNGTIRNFELKLNRTQENKWSVEFTAYRDEAKGKGVDRDYVDNALRAFGIGRLFPGLPRHSTLTLKPLGRQGSSRLFQITAEYGGTRYVRRFGLQDGTDNIELLDEMARQQPKPLERKQTRTFQYEEQERRAALYFQPGIKKEPAKAAAKVVAPVEQKKEAVPVTSKVALGISGRSQYQNALDTLLRNLNNGKVPTPQHMALYEKAYGVYKSDGKLDARQLQALEIQRRQMLTRVSRAADYEKEKTAFDKYFSEVTTGSKGAAADALTAAFGRLRNAAAAYQELLSDSNIADGRVRQEIGDREKKVRDYQDSSIAATATAGLTAGGIKSELRPSEPGVLSHADLQRFGFYETGTLPGVNQEWESLRGELRVETDFEVSTVDRIEVTELGAQVYLLDGQVISLPKVHRGTATGLVFTGRDSQGLVYALKVAVNKNTDVMVARGAYITKTLNPFGETTNLSQLVWEGRVEKEGQSYFATLVKNPAGVEFSRVREKLSLVQSIDLFQRWAELITDIFKGRYGKAMAMQDLKLDNVLMGPRGMVIPIDPDGAQFRYEEDQPTSLDFVDLAEGHPLKEKLTLWTEGLAYNRRTSPLASPLGSSLSRFFVRDPDFPLRQSALFGYMTFYQLVKNIYPFIFRDGSADPLPDSLKTPAERTAEREGKLPAPLVGNFTGAKAMDLLFEDLGIATPEGVAIPQGLTESDLQALIETVLQIENLTVLDYEDQEQEAWIEGKFDRLLELLGSLKQQTERFREAVSETAFDVSAPSGTTGTAEVSGTLVQGQRAEMRVVMDSRTFSIPGLDFRVRLAGKEIQVMSGDGQTVLRSKELGPGERLTVGRNPNNDLSIASLNVSRLHFMIQREGDRYFLVDATSQNGTTIKGLEGRITRVELELQAEAPAASPQPEFLDDLGPKIPDGFGARGTFKIGGIRPDPVRQGKQIRIVEDALINAGTPFRLASLTFRVRAMTDEEQRVSFAAQRGGEEGESPLQTGEILPYLLEVYDVSTRVVDGQAVKVKGFIPLPHVYFTPQGSVFIGRTDHPERTVPKASEFPDDLGGVRPLDLEENRRHDQLTGMTRIAIYEISPDRDGVFLPYRMSESQVSRYRTTPDENTRVEDHRSDQADYIPEEESAYARPGHVEISIVDTEKGPMIRLTDRGSYNGTVIESTPEVRKEFIQMMDPSLVSEADASAVNIKAGPGESTAGTFILPQGQAAEVLKGEPLVFHAKYPFRIRVEDPTGKARFIVTLQLRDGQFHIYDDAEHTMDRQVFAANQSQIQGRPLPFTVEARQIAGKMRAIIRLAENVKLGFVPRIIVTTLNDQSRGELRAQTDLETQALRFGELVKQRNLVERLIQGGASDSIRPLDGRRILFLTQAQFDKVGQGAVLISRDGNFFVKGKDDASSLVAEQLFMMPAPVLPVGILLDAGKKDESRTPGIQPSPLGSVLAGEVAAYITGYIEQNLGLVSEEQMSPDQMAPFVENQIARRADAFSTSLYRELKALGIDVLQEQAIEDLKDLVAVGLDFSDQELQALAADLDSLGVNLESLQQQLSSNEGVASMVGMLMVFAPPGSSMSLTALLDMLKRLLLNIPDGIRFKQTRQRQAADAKKLFPRSSENPSIRNSWPSYFDLFTRLMEDKDQGLAALFEKSGRPSSWDGMEDAVQERLSRFLKGLLLDGGLGTIPMNPALRGRDVGELYELPLEDLADPSRRGDLFDLQQSVLLDLRDYFNNHLARNELRSEGAIPKEKSDPAMARQVSRMVVEILGKDQVPAAEEILKAAQSADQVLEHYDVESFISMLREEALKVEGVIDSQLYAYAVNNLLDELGRFLSARYPNQSFTLALDLESPNEGTAYAEGLGRISDYLGRLLVRGNLGEAGREFRKVLGARLSPVRSLDGRQVLDAGQVVLPAITPGVFQQALDPGVFGVQLLKDSEGTLDPRVESYAKLMQLVVGLMAAANLRDPSQSRLSGTLLRDKLKENMSLIMEFPDNPLSVSENGAAISLSKVASFLTSQYLADRQARVSA